MVWAIWALVEVLHVPMTHAGKKMFTKSSGNKDARRMTAIVFAFFFLLDCSFLAWLICSCHAPFHHSKSLPLLRDVSLLKILCILIAQLEMHILHSLLDPLFAADTNYRANALLDTPGRRNASHAYVVLLRDFLNPLNDLLVGRKLALVD
jgi:hypothetical protein